MRREGTREPRRRGAICCCWLSRQPQARSGQTVGEVRPTSLPSSSTVVTISAGLRWTDAKRKVPPTSYFLRRSPDSVHRQSAELPCCASYLQFYCSGSLEVWPTLSVVLVIVYCLPSVTHSAPCRCALKVSGSRPSCLRLTPLFLAELVSGNPTSSQTAANASVAQNLFSPRWASHCWRQAPPLRGSNVHAGLHRFRNGGLHDTSLQHTTKCDVYTRRELYAISSCQVARPCSTRFSNPRRRNRRRSVHHSFDVAHVQDETSDSGICSSSQFAACSCNSASRKLSVRSLCCR